MLIDRNNQQRNSMSIYVNCGIPSDRNAVFEVAAQQLTSRGHSSQHSSFMNRASLTFRHCTCPIGYGIAVWRLSRDSKRIVHSNITCCVQGTGYQQLHNNEQTTQYNTTQYNTTQYNTIHLHISNIISQNFQLYT